MSEMNDIVKLAVDMFHGKVEKYSAEESRETLRNALIAANNNSTKLDIRAIRDGKCAGLFALVEEILRVTVVDELQQDDFFMTMVDYRNLALGDQNLFLVEDNVMFVVDEIAEGTQGIRRQRLGGSVEKSIPTTLKAVRIYEELNRVLAGRVDFNEMIAKVSESFRQRMLQDIYALWEGVAADDMGGATYFPAAGAYDVDDLLDMVAHVEAAAGGKPATIVGTKMALRRIAPDIESFDSKNDLYNLGYYGKFYGTPVVAIPNRHKANSTEFIMDDNTLTIVASPEKPIKYVTEGDPLVIMGDPLKNADLTHEFFFAERTGLGIVLANNTGIGRYKMTPKA